jgi:hypothetical protein
VGTISVPLVEPSSVGKVGGLVSRAVSCQAEAAYRCFDILYNGGDDAA